MSVIYEDENIQVIETITANGKTVQAINKPGSVGENVETLHSRATAALASNAAYLSQPAIPASPTLAQLTSAVRIIRDQVDALTRQNNAIIRLDLRLLDSIDNT